MSHILSIKHFGYTERNPNVLGSFDIPVVFDEVAELGSFSIHVDRVDSVRLAGNVGWKVKTQGAAPLVCIQFQLFRNGDLVYSVMDSANPATDKLRLTPLSTVSRNRRQDSLALP